MKLGGKGVFVTEIEEAISNHQADIAVHSLKDVPSILNETFDLFFLPNIADHRDVFISPYPINELPKNAIIGTSSLRRQLQFQKLYPNSRVKNIRGSIATRLEKLNNGLFDGIILAKAGLDRLNLNHLIQHTFSIKEILPAPCQGVIGLQCLTNTKISKWLDSVCSNPTLTPRLIAERSLIEKLGGSCTLPLAAFSTITNNSIELEALLIDPISKKELYSKQTGINPIDLADSVNLELRNQGADAIIKQFN